jgi:hypothetical protein
VRGRIAAAALGVPIQGVFLTLLICSLVKTAFEPNRNLS